MSSCLLTLLRFLLFLFSPLPVASLQFPLSAFQLLLSSSHIFLQDALFAVTLFFLTFHLTFLLLPLILKFTLKLTGAFGDALLFSHPLLLNALALGCQ
jgi:hypothetical protein